MAYFLLLFMDDLLLLKVVIGYVKREECELLLGVGEEGGGGFGSWENELVRVRFFLMC